MKRYFRFLSLFFILLALFGCSSNSERSIHAYVNLTPAITISPSPKPTATQVPTPVYTPAQLPVSVAIGGDVMFDSHISNLIDNNGVDYYIEDISPVFRNSDIAMINLETAISTRGEREKDKQFTFRAEPKYLQILSSSGINVVTLANNHSLDYGVTALEDTFINLKEKDISYVGAGRNINEASQALYINKNNLKIAILGSSHVIPFVSWNAGSNYPGLATTYDPSRLIAEIKKAKKLSDFVICYIHWGEEGKSMPVDYQRNLAHSYIDNGADLVVGSHPHILQGIEYYNDKMILYSLGNLVFTDMNKKTSIAKITLHQDKTIKLKMLPFEIVSFRPTLIRDKVMIQKLFTELEKLSYGIQIDVDGNVLPQK